MKKGSNIEFKVTNDLIIGNEEIDNEHLQLIAIINKINRACYNGVDRTEIVRILDFLTEYTIAHFKKEEELQSYYNYPGALKHKLHHQHFLDEVALINEKFHHEGSSVALVSEINLMLVNWLFTHIRTEDRDLALYIQNLNK